MHVRSARKNCFGLVFDFRFLATSPRLLSAVPCMEAHRADYLRDLGCLMMAGGHAYVSNLNAAFYKKPSCRLAARTPSLCGRAWPYVSNLLRTCDISPEWYRPSVPSAWTLAAEPRVRVRGYTYCQANCHLLRRGGRLLGAPRRPARP